MTSWSHMKFIEWYFYIVFLYCFPTDPKILSLGLIQSLFEGSMYTFVLEWTPALTPHQPSSDNTGIARSLLSEDDDGHIGTIPHGYIFAAFMVI